MVPRMFNDDQLMLIYKDQENLLEGVHTGCGGDGPYACSDMVECPLNHFEGDMEEISLRKEIIEIIQKDILKRVKKGERK